ncbi:MAG: vitamin B12 dependent-methionine synthase activation domain-containing protein [Candidatus Hodgkinia cicadicola]
MEARIKHAVINGLEKHIEDDSRELALKVGAVGVIEGVLMGGMNAVGKLFGDGKMFLPQVVKSVRVMKKAVSVLTPLIKKVSTQVSRTVLMATVKGDVHDIGKSIVATVLACNNYKILDLGIMVPAKQIADMAIKGGVCAVGLSGLISSSLEEMVNVAKVLQARGCSIPLLIGGAATSKLHTAVKLSPYYVNGVIVHVSNASKAVEVMAKLTSESSVKYISDIKAEYAKIAKLYARSKLCQNKISFLQAQSWTPKPKRILIKAATITGFKLSVASAISRPSAKLKAANTAAARNWNLANKMASRMNSERWIAIRRKIGVLFASKSKQGVVLETSSGRRLSVLSFARQQNGACLSLADFISDTKDHMGFYCCVVGPESLLIQRYFRTAGKLRYAAAFKDLCDALVEACSEAAFEALRLEIWGFADSGTAGAEGVRGGIRPAPGYSMWPDHSVKLELCKLMAAEHSMGLIVNNELTLVPQSSLIAAVVGEVSAIYFGIESLEADQVEEYARANRLSTKLVESLLSAVISYVPKLMTE